MVRCSLASAVWCIFAVWAVAQPVPPESALPDETANQTDVPSEAVLPAAEQDTKQPQAELPGERVLPGAAAIQQDNVTALPGDVRPWLRMAMEGHTGTVRALDLHRSGETLFSGGDDKDLHIWRRSDFAKTNWIHRRVVRWQVNRGPRGRIYAIASQGNEVAIAGHGASGRLGEIWVIDSESGNLIRPFIDEQDGHRQVIQSLAWSRGGDTNKPRLVSQDVQGQVMVWRSDPRTGLWSGRTIIKPDTQTYGEQIAGQLKSERGFVPAVFDSQDSILTPRFVGFTQTNPPWGRWHLQRTNVDSGQSIVLDSVDHLGGVVALDVSAKGDKLVSTDAAGKITLWTFGAAGTVQRIQSINPGNRSLFIDLDDAGERLLLGTEVAIIVEGQPRARVQLWDVSGDTPNFQSEVYPVIHALAGALNLSHREALIASANRIEAYSFDAAGKFGQAGPRVLSAPIGPVRRVAFASEQTGGYKIAIGSEPAQNGSIELDRVFDLTKVALAGKAPIDDGKFEPPQKQKETWSFRRVNTRQGFRRQLYQGDAPRGVLPLKPEIHGDLTSLSTITKSTDQGIQSVAVVVGTHGRNSIYVYRADEANPPKLLRQFRGHAGSVLSTSTSADGRYLASGSEDTTVCLWNLGDIFTAGESVNRWGVDFQIENNRLVAQAVRDDGPLYFRGVRGGDRLINISWTDENGNAESESDPEAMLKQLTSLPFDTLVVFRFTRLGRARPGFQSFAAWHPLATLFVDDAREWAFWTPAGYYDASFNGHRRFGWQINRDVNRLPDFFRAAQFREALERPDIMRRLLEAGSLPRAMRGTHAQLGPPPGEGAIVNQYLNKPRIRVLTPKPGELIERGSLTVRAEIEVPLGATLAPPKSFLSGVPAIKVRRIGQQDGRETYQWEFRVPRDETLQLEVVAATEAEAVDRVRIELKQAAAKHDRSLRLPRLHLLAIGVGDYRDPQIQSLDFAADAAGAIADLFRNHASTLYRVSADQLVDRDATRPLWRIYAEQAAERLTDVVSPDDLVVMYLCGHGLRDRRTNEWYFVTAEAKYGQLMNDQFDDCLSFQDLALLAEVPCRKLAILDSCHSGAVQPVMRSDDLKSALRFLQDDLVLTFTASEGEEEAAERRETGLGRFTTRLVEALQGKADEQGDGDGVVTLAEAIEYVRKSVARESEAEGMPQHPTASPEYLIRQLQLPLTQSGGRSSR